jgi:hypothetical protein
MRPRDEARRWRIQRRGGDWSVLPPPDVCEARAGIGTFSARPVGLEVVKLQKEAMTAKNVTINPELFARVTEEAAAEGTTADEIANEAMKRYLAVRRVDRLQRYGHKRAEKLASPRMTFLA